jgi:low density lipoprotein receptor-related protein 5/6
MKTNRHPFYTSHGLVRLTLLLLVLLLPASLSFAGAIYWVDSGTNKIQRANLDGTNPVDVMSNMTGYPGNPVGSASGLTLNVPAGKVYWTETGSNLLKRASLDGANQQILVSNHGCHSIDLDLVNDKMYWYDTFVLSRLGRANLDGSGIEDLTLFQPNDRIGIAVDPIGGKLYLTNRDIPAIERTNLDGSGYELLVSTNLVDPREIALDIDGAMMYWADTQAGKIQRAYLDGSGLEDVVINLAEPHGIAVDPLAGKVYWTDFGADKIQRANLDGTEVEDLVTGLPSPIGIALDLQPEPCAENGGDSDGDGVCDDIDNCPYTTNPDQADSDGNGTGDACDECLTFGGDADQDGICNDNDNCPLAVNPDQADFDSDWVGDVCDNCPTDTNLDQADTDGNGIGDACDVPADNTPPEIVLTAFPEMLWPPNHKLVPIDLTVTVTDDQDPEPGIALLSITSNESDQENAYHVDYDIDLSAGYTFDDIYIDSSGKISLRAERSGKGDGRIYTITYQATDATGNVSTASVTVTVPHNR